MSSITDRHRHDERGQVLVIFTMSLFVLIGIAALVFDIGFDLYERRKQQDAADAAALAGARFMNEPLSCLGVYTLAACPGAVQAATDLAAKNGYVDGVDGVVVDIAIPPRAGTQFAGAPGHIEVSIGSSRTSFFAGLFGLVNRNVASTAVAANIDEYSVPASFIALEPLDCNAAIIGGNGTIEVGGAIQVNSACTQSNGALHGAGTNFTMTAPDCNVVGSVGAVAASNFNCGGVGQWPDTGQPPILDPLASMEGPTLSALPDPADAVEILSGTGNATGCPDGLPPGETQAGTRDAPVTCNLGAKDTVFRIHPGVYWGGISIQGNNSGPTTIYIEKGIYYLAGGGLRITGGAAYIMTTGPNGVTPGGGILLYNSEDPEFHDECAADPGFNAGCIGAIDIGGNDTAGFIELWPFEFAPYANVLIFQDRDLASQPAIKIDGEGRAIRLSGTIYAPEANVQLTGRGESVTVQVIADTWKITGNGTFEVTYDPNALVKLQGVGLVQ